MRIKHQRTNTRLYNKRAALSMSSFKGRLAPITYRKYAISMMEKTKMDITHISGLISDLHRMTL